MPDTITSYYPYDINHVLPIVFAVLVGISLGLHTWQNLQSLPLFVGYVLYRLAGAIFTAGWIMRCILSYSPGNKNLYIVQTALILGGPPIYSAVQYNVLGRLMLRLPMHAPLNPNRVVIVFIYLGAAVESLTAVGAVQWKSAGNDSKLRSGLRYLSISLVLQFVVELLFMAIFGLIHYRCVKAKMFTPKIRTLCIMLCGTSLLILIRGIFRSVESFSHLSVLSDSCRRDCVEILTHEWYIYVFEAAPVVLYTYWLNIVNPGIFLPRDWKTYLEFDRVERLGPAWVDRRSRWQTFADPLDFEGVLSGNPAHDKFWEKPDEWGVVDRSLGPGRIVPVDESAKLPAVTR